MAINSQGTLRCGVGPQFGIVGRTNREVGHIAFGLDEIGRQAIEQLGLLHGIGTLARYIVEEEGKGTHAQIVHPVEFIHQILVVFFVPFDILPRVNGPNEIDPVAAARLDERLNLFGLLLGIGQAPIGATVIGIVFGAIEVTVHLELTIEIDQRHAHLVRPGSTIEALDHTTVFQVGIIVNLDIGQMAVGHSRALDQLTQGLQAIEGSPLVIPHNGDTLFVDLQPVGTCHLFHTMPGRRFLSKIDREFHPLLIQSKERHIGRKLALQVLQVDPLREVERVSPVEGHLLRRGIHHDTAVIEFLTGDGQHILRLGTLARQIELGLLSPHTTAGQHCDSPCGQYFATLYHIFGFLMFFTGRNEPYFQPKISIICVCSKNGDSASGAPARHRVSSRGRPLPHSTHTRTGPPARFRRM